MKVQKKKVTNPVCSQQFKAVPQQKRIISTVKEKRWRSSREQIELISHTKRMKKRGNRSLSLRFYYEFSQQEGLTVLSKPAKKTGDHPFPRSPAIKHYQTTKPNPNTTSKPSQLNKASHLEVTRNSQEERLKLELRNRLLGHRPRRPG
jgi:hypothetical protein